MIPSWILFGMIIFYFITTEIAHCISDDYSLYGCAPYLLSVYTRLRGCEAASCCAHACHALQHSNPGPCVHWVALSLYSRFCVCYVARAKVRRLGYHSVMARTYPVSFFSNRHLVFVETSSLSLLKFSGVRVRADLMSTRPVVFSPVFVFLFIFYLSTCPLLCIGKNSGSRAVAVNTIWVTTWVIIFAFLQAYKLEGLCTCFWKCILNWFVGRCADAVVDRNNVPSVHYCRHSCAGVCVLLLHVRKSFSSLAVRLTVFVVTTYGRCSLSSASRFFSSGP